MFVRSCETLMNYFKKAFANIFQIENFNMHIFNHEFHLMERKLDKKKHVEIDSQPYEQKN